MWPSTMVSGGSGSKPNRLRLRASFRPSLISQTLIELDPMSTPINAEGGLNVPTGSSDVLIDFEVGSGISVLLNDDVLEPFAVTDIAALSGAMIRGLQQHGLAATAKHFPGGGFDDRDSIGPISRPPDPSDPCRA